MQTINNIENGLLLVLFLGVLALQLWALVDCITRKAPAFPAAGKLTKPTWILLTAVAVAPVALLQDVTNLLAYIGIIVSSVYLADVRPAVREISGPSRW
ncbi:DUF2516 family protein [Jatrophihabitans sp.]|uniref:DUF2516 family protein n=1 Tax=Jatrophihabitans sp. TaxID=1932789 RepID=UPI0027B78B4C|nr:hypothetical protein [Pseudonocardiales bacterium]